MDNTNLLQEFEKVIERAIKNDEEELGVLKQMERKMPMWILHWNYEYKKTFMLIWKDYLARERKSLKASIRRKNFIRGDLQRRFKNYGT